MRGWDGEVNTGDETLEVGIFEGARFDERIKHAIENDG